MNMRKNYVLAIFAVISGVVLLISNLAAMKIFSFFGVPMDAGILIYPVLYVISDLILAVAGKDSKFPRIIIWASFAMNLLAALVLLIAVKLPAYPGWENQEAFETIFGFAPRVILGSLVAYVVSGLVNIIAFKAICCKNHKNEDGETEETGMFMRMYGSSAVAKIFDVVIFEIIAFIGVLPFKDFVLQTVFAYGAGMLLEMPLSALASGIYNRFFKSTV